MRLSSNFSPTSDCQTIQHDYDNIPQHTRQNSTDKLRSKFKSSPNIRAERAPSGGPDISVSGRAEHRRSGSLPRSRAKNLSSGHPGTWCPREGQIELHSAVLSGTSSLASTIYNRDLSKSSVFPIQTNQGEHKRSGSLPRSRARILRGCTQAEGGNLGSRAQSQPPEFQRHGLSPLRLSDRHFDITVRSRDQDHYVDGSFQPSYSYRNNRSCLESSLGDRDSLDLTSRQTESPKSAPYWSSSTSTRHFF